MLKSFDLVKICNDIKYLKLLAKFEIRPSVDTIFSIRHSKKSTIDIDDLIEKEKTPFERMDSICSHSHKCHAEESQTSRGFVAISRNNPLFGSGSLGTEELDGEINEEEDGHHHHHHHHEHEHGHHHEKR